MAKAKGAPQARVVRCAIYTRKSTDEGLDKEFNSLDAQRESAENFVRSQQHEGWTCLSDRYDDGGFTGGNIDRPAVQRLLADINAGKIDCVVVYKVDRLSRSLLDFSRLMETFDKHHVSFVSVTQQFNTTHSMGRLTLNILLSFAQFEREIIGERTRDKIAAARRKGRWSGGPPILGYDIDARGGKLVVNPEEATRVRAIFDLYNARQSLLATVRELARKSWTTKRWTTREGHDRGGKAFTKGNLYRLLTNVVYTGRVRYKTEVHPGQHAAILDEGIWESVRQLLGRQKNRDTPNVRISSRSILKGILRCSACEAAMSPSHTTRGIRKYRYYVCQGAQKCGWETCPSPSIPAGEIERYVLAQIDALLTDRECLKRLDAAPGDRGNGGGDELLAARMTALAADSFEFLEPDDHAFLVTSLVRSVYYDGKTGRLTLAFCPQGIQALQHAVGAHEQEATWTAP